jgi:hypothetical protein
MGHQIEKDDKGSAQAAVAWNRFQIAVEQKSIRREKSFQRIQNLNVLLIGTDRFPPKKNPTRSSFFHINIYISACFALILILINNVAKSKAPLRVLLAS